MKWLAVTVLVASGCSSERPPCATCTEAGSTCAPEDASAYGWVTCGASQVFRTCTCSSGTWDCGDCPDASDASAD